MGAAVELVGLPGSGKSHVLEHGNLGPGDAQIVPSGRFSIEKSLNVLRGMRSHPTVARMAFADSARTRPRPKVSRDWLIMLERIGRVTNPQAMLDEGPLQAAWGLFHWRPTSAANLSLFTELLDALPPAERLMYVSAGKDYAAMIASRERTHPSYSTSPEDQRRARDWMAALLTHVRRERSVVRYLNQLEQQPLS